MSAQLFDVTRPAKIERLAKIEGQSNFLSLLAGIEASPDSTEDMAALAFARAWGCVPEVLEAYVAKSDIFKLPLMSAVYYAIGEEFANSGKAIRGKDRLWVMGAIADAFMIMRDGFCRPIEFRAKRFKVDKHVYAAMRKLAGGIFTSLIGDAESAWTQCRFSDSTRDTTSSRHTSYASRDKRFVTREQMRREGNYFASSLPTDPDGEYTRDIRKTHGVGMADRLGWDERHSVASPCTTIESPAPPPATALVKTDVE